MSVDIVGFVNLVGIRYMAYMDPRDHTTQIRPIYNNLRFWACRTLEFFLSICHKDENCNEFNEFLAQILSLGKKVPFLCNCHGCPGVLSTGRHMDAKFMSSRPHPTIAVNKVKLSL